jgi:hypothetical protein
VNTLLERAEAALRVIEDDPSVDRLLLLEQVIWPSQAIVQAAPEEVGPLTHAEVEQMAELAAQGWTHRRIGEQYRRPRSTVSAALQRREKRVLADAAVTV